MTVAVIVTAGIVPLAIQLASLWDRRSILTIPGGASVEIFATVLVPPVLVVSVILGSLLARMSDRVRIAPVPARSSTFVLLAGWLLIPVVTIFLVSALTPVDFVWARYFSSVGPAIALFAGWGIASLEPAAVRRMVAIVLALLSVLAYGGKLKNGEDWQGTAAFERNTPIPPRSSCCTRSSWNRRSWIGSPIRRSAATSYRCSPTTRWKGG